MGDTLVDEAGRGSNRQGIASIVASVTIPAGLAQSVVCHGSFGSDPGRTRVRLGRAWSRRKVAENITVPGGMKRNRLGTCRRASGCTKG